MKSLVLLALLLVATKKLGECVLSFFCLLLLGFGIYLLIRHNPTCGLLSGLTGSRRA